MSSDRPDTQAMTRTTVTVKAKSFELTFRAAVPSGPTTPAALLPLARALSEVMVNESSKAEAAAGNPVSCSAGCGACCRTLVAISQIEARQIAELVQALDEPRRSVIVARFDAAVARLAAAGLLAKLRDADAWTASDYATMIGDYFALGIACPFLEEESCSIYSERPLTCREFLVTSAPRHCGVLASDQVRRVRLPLKMFNVVARWAVPQDGAFMERWVPMMLAPEWAPAHPDTAEPKTGQVLLAELLACIEQYEA